jgi:3-oxoacyl-[acyl-carrier protein] reductase
VIIKPKFKSFEKTKFELKIRSLEPADVIIHASGGGLGMSEPLIGIDHFDRVYYHNFGQIVEFNRIVLKHNYNKNLKIIHIGSTASIEAVGSVSYNCAKATLNAYVKSLGRTIADKGPIICGINLGAYFENDNSMGRLKKINKNAFEEFVENRLPRKKMIFSHEIIPLFKFLVDESIDYLSGSMINCDSGELKSYSL